jgi:hypothetical protein
MDIPTRRPRKQRTRQHVIADLGVHHVERFILEGHTAQRLGSDYGYDLIMWTFDEQGYPEPDSAYFQVKAAETLKGNATEYVYDVDRRDLNLWMWERTPVILVLFDAAVRRGYWLHVQSFFRADGTWRMGRELKTVRVRVSRRQPMNRRAIARIRDLKRKAQRPILGVQP